MSSAGPFPGMKKSEAAVNVSITGGPHPRALSPLGWPAAAVESFFSTALLTLLLPSLLRHSSGTTGFRPASSRGNPQAQGEGSSPGYPTTSGASESVDKCLFLLG